MNDVYNSKYNKADNLEFWEDIKKNLKKMKQGHSQILLKKFIKKEEIMLKKLLNILVLVKMI